MNRLIVFFFLGASLVSAHAASLITTNATWKYFKGVSEASSPSSAWRTNGFNDAAWLSGQAPFYYENDPTSATAYSGNTDLTDMYGKYSCIFMRQKFVVTNLTEFTELLLTAMSDDGFIAWINGTEVARFNMPGGNIAYNGIANPSLPEPVPVQYDFLVNPTNYLVSGTNVLAIQAFNSAVSGSDFLIWAGLDTSTNLPAPDVALISEFMATNQATIPDQDGDFSPWIELFNPMTNDMSLNGWSLTTDTNNLRQWIFPDVTLSAQSFIVLFASGKNRATNTAELHTNFRLPVAGGFLALVNPDTNIVSSFDTYPAQFPDVSYGRDPLTPGLTGYYSTPTPDDENAAGGAYAAPPVTFSRAGGTFIDPFNLQLATVANAVVHYTLDGAAPTEASAVYATDIVISASVIVRARAFLPGLLPGALQGETYLQLDSGLVATNSNLPAIVLYNFGAGTVPVDDDQFVNLAIYEPSNGVTSLTTAPTLNTRAGIHLHGSSTLSIDKHSFSVSFWDEANLDANYSPLGMPAESDWILYAPNQFEPVMIHNPLIYELSNEMGRYASRTRFVEVYLNLTGGPLTPADYNGVYVLEEKIKWDKNRVDITKIHSVDELHPLDNTLSNVTGGYIMKLDRLGDGETGFNAVGQTIVYDHPNEADIKTPQRAPQMQYLQNYMNSFGTALNGADYTNLNGGFRAFVDVPSWIDVHIINVMTLNPDGLRLSTYFYKDRNDILHMGPIWDYDRTMGSSDGRDFNPLSWHGNSTDFFNFPWWGRMFKDVEFFQAWIDRYQSLRASQLATNNIFGLIDADAAQVTQQEPRDVARWPYITAPRSGLISTNGYSYNFPGTYAGEVAFIKQWYTDRFGFMDTNFVARPVFSKAGLYLPGDTLTLTSPNGGTNYYTTNGTDPRLPGGGVSTNARAYSIPIALSANLTVTARAYNGAHHNLTGSGNPPLSSSWSGPLTATYAPGAVPVITQSPVDLDAYLGQTIVFTVQATGNPAPGYQWQHQGVTLANQTNTVLSFLLTNVNQAGAYSVIVTNLVGTNSAAWNLNITPKPNLVITEAESSESKGAINSTLDHQDWWELSNLGNFAVNLRGYRFDDSHASLTVAEVLTNNVSIVPGESVVLVEDMTPDQFRNWWGAGNLPPALQIITYPNIGYSSSGDAIYVWNAAATNNADTVATATFPAATRGVSFGYNPDTGVFGALSVAGSNGAFAAATNADIGSPGTFINLPRLSQVQINGADGFGFNLVTQPNRNYQIQYKDDLTAADWLSLTNFTATGNSFTLTDPVGGTNAARYYRVLLTP